MDAASTLTVLPRHWISRLNLSAAKKTPYYLSQVHTPVSPRCMNLSQYWLMSMYLILSLGALRV